jgi:serine/threonine protein kinase/tetratricopeptide (TPR) repeat protein
MSERDIFIAALQKEDSAQRHAYLDDACTGRPELRRQVDNLLRLHEGAGSFLENPAAGPMGIPREPGDAQAGLSTAACAAAIAVDAPGAMIGPYRLLEQIGEGGFGVVFMAEQTQPLRRQVALKVLKTGMDTRQIVTRFEAERQALAIMDHPHIAKVHDGGITVSGRPYFVMELVKGQPITAFCDQNHLTPRQRLELFVAVCQAVQHAHQKGIIHRDLKPSNVLVALCDGKPVPKVIDFGVAKAVGQSLTAETMVTGFGAIVGTLEYMPPEQAVLNQLDIDTRSDVYSLGVLLYELLTGSPPFSRIEIDRSGMLEMLRVIREQEPSKPSTKLSTAEGLPTLAANRGMEPAKLTKLVRGELDWIVMKALEKDRDRRYETANALATDVQRYLADEPVLACPPSAGYRFKKFARRNKGRLTVAAGVFVAVTVTAASLGWTVRDRAARAAAVAARGAEVEGQVRDTLNTARVMIAENKLTAARRKLAQARGQLNEWPALDALTAEIEAGEAQLDLFQQILDLIERAHEAETAPLLEATVAADGPRPSGQLSVASPGVTHVIRGRYIPKPTPPPESSPVSQAPPKPPGKWERRPAAAVPLLREALRCYGDLEHGAWDRRHHEGLLGAQQVEHIRRLVYEELLWLADDIVRRQEAHQSEGWISREAAAREALVYLGKAESTRPPTQALYALRAHCRNAVGEATAAQADQKRADQTLATTALDHYLRGQAAYDAKQLAEGVQAFEAALRLEPTHYWSLMWLGYCLCDLGQTPEDFTGAARVFTGCILKRPDHAHAHYCRGNAYSRLRRYQDAVADFSRAIELSPSYTSAWNNRALAYYRLDRPEKTVEDSSRAIELNPDSTSAWNNRGWAHNKLNQPQQAISDFTRAIQLNPKSATAWCGRGLAHIALDQPDKAVEDCSRAIQLDPNYTSAWNNRGVAHNKLNQPDQAVADFSTAIKLDAKYALALFNRGATHFKLGQTEKAITDLSEFIGLAPDQPERLVRAYLQRAQAHGRLSRHAQARADYQAALKHAPDHAGALNGLAWLLATCPNAKLRDPEQAVKLAGKAVQQVPTERTYWQTLGMAHYRAGDNKAAVVALDKSVELSLGGDAVDRLFLALVHRKLGNQGAAHNAYEQALQWLEKNKESLEKDTARAEELRRFQAEADEALQLKKK